MSGFVYLSEPTEKHSVAFSFISRRELKEVLESLPGVASSNVFPLEASSFLTIPSGDAIVDTGATQDLIGATAYRALEHRLKDVGLQPVVVDAPYAAPSGVGGKAAVEKVALIPVSPGGCAGVLQMVVLTAGIPPLLSIGFLTFLGSLLDLPRNKIIFSKFGQEVPMPILPSGHRTISLVEWAGGRFDVPEPLQQKFGLSDGAFNLTAGSSLPYMKRVSCASLSGFGHGDEAPGGQSDDLLSANQVPCDLNREICHSVDQTSSAVGRSGEREPAASDPTFMMSQGHLLTENSRQCVGPSPMCDIKTNEFPASASKRPVTALMEQRTPFRPGELRWRAMISRILIVMESSRLMFFKLALAERSKKHMQLSHLHTAPTLSSPLARRHFSAETQGCIAPTPAPSTGTSLTW